MSYQVAADLPLYPPPPYSEEPLPVVYSEVPSAPPLELMEAPYMPPLANPTNIYATVDRRKLHIAYDQYYQGCINSYNWWITKLFAKIFGWSIDVTIDNKHRQLEKKSYLAFLHAHGVANATKETLHTITQLDPASHLRLENKGTMSQALSKGKVHRLTKKMIAVTLKKDEGHAIKTLGRGANPNKVFWVNEANNKLLFIGKDEDKFRQTLPQRSISRFTVTQYTPFLYAGHKELEQLKIKLVTCGANTHLPGLQLSFERIINDVQTHNDHRLSVQPVLVPSKTKSLSGPRLTLAAKTEWRWDKITTTTTTYSDRLQKLNHIYFRNGAVSLNACTDEEARPRTCSWNTSTQNKQNIVSFVH